MTKLTTLIALLALAMLVIVPASAVWHNGNWLTDEEYSELTDGTNVIYNPQSGVSSKYKAVDNGQNDYQYSCDLRGSIRAHTNTLSPEVLVSNDLSPDVTTKLPVLPDGSFEFTGLAYGNYTLTLLGDAGNGGQTETAKVVCGAPGGVVYPQRELMGHAVAGSDAPVVCQREIVSAEYGAFEQECHEELVSEAWVEHFGKYVKYESGCWVWYENVGQGNGDYIRHSCGQFCSWYEHVAPENHPAEYETVCEQVGGSTPVTQNIREALAKGYTSFLFDNAHNPGGIFDVTTTDLLSTITDPAPGIVKHVSITYKDCSGNEQTIEAEEYEVINLT